MTAKTSEMGVSAKGKAGWKSVLRVSRKSTPVPPPTPVDTPPRQPSPAASSTLEKKYGPARKALGEGAFGSIFLVDRPSDGATFAVKKFRRRHSLEDSREYARKISREFHIGSRLQHQNVIKTLELFQEGDQWSQVMEYAPFCLFDCVASKAMSPAEISCAFMQVLAGVHHLHECGFAHRDLKLENVVVSAEGVMKVIDFGTATSTATGTSSKVVLSTGMVGCLPYMAPEVLKYHYYDAQRADVWSLAITFACMVLGKFPWKAADRTDRAFRAFTAAPPTRKAEEGSSDGEDVTVINVTVGSGSDKEGREKEDAASSQGPWGLLRRLPVESRQVIGRMLSVEPRRRPLLGEILESDWAREVEVCQVEDGGRVCPAEGHRHTLKGGSI